jgi:hypothetical protein
MAIINDKIEAFIDGDIDIQVCKKYEEIFEIFCENKKIPIIKTPGEFWAKYTTVNRRWAELSLDNGNISGKEMLNYIIEENKHSERNSLLEKKEGLIAELEIIENQLKVIDGGV